MTMNNEQTVHLPDTMPFFPYFIQGNKIMKVETDMKGKTKIKEIARRTEIVAIQKDINTKQVTLHLSFNYMGDTQTIEIARGVLARNKITELLQYGVDVVDHKKMDVLMFLSKQEETAPLVYTHQSIGFDKVDEQLIFKHWQAIGVDSNYKGPLLLQPQGTYKRWHSLIQEHAIGHTPLELALVLGLSAPISSLIARYTGLEVIVFHIYGDSSQGKTTALRVATASFGYPHTKEGGLIKTWNGTQNAMLASLRNNYGVPIAFDEASMHSGDFSKFVYLLASGQEKQRLDRESQLREQGGWEGVILSTAEHSLQTKSKQNIGIQMRLFEIGNTNWTTSAQNADALKEGLLQNYGHAGFEFVKYIMALGDDTIYQKWNQWRELIGQCIDNPDHFSQRISDKLAILMVTAEIAREALELTLDIDSILGMLMEMVKETSDQRDIGEKAYSFFLESVTKNRLKFVTDGTFGGSYECWGKLVEKDGRPYEVYILTNVFESMMREGNFEDVTVILRNWKAKKLLDHENGKLTRKKTILRGIDNRVYVVRLQQADLPRDGASSRKIRSRPNPTAKLFRDDESSPD